MVKKKLIKDHSLNQIKDSYSSIYNALRNFKKLSEQATIVFIEIMKKEKITVDILKGIIKEKGLQTTTTKPYAILKNLMDANLLFCEDKTAKNKQYRSINPNDLYLDIKDNIEDLDGELTRIQAEKEEKEVLEEESQKSGILETYNEISNEIGILVKNKYEIEFFYNPLLIKESDMIYKRLKKHFSLNPKKGKFCMITAIKKGEKLFPKIVILLLRNTELKNDNPIIGNKIVDPEIFDYLANGVV